MKKPLRRDVASVVGLVGGLASTIALYQVHPWLAYVALCLLASWVTAILYRARGRAIEKITKGASVVERHLKDEDFRPDVVIAFTRTSAIFAGIVAVRMEVPAILVFNRVPEAEATTGARTFRVGPGISLDPKEFGGRKLLVVAYVVETGTSLKTGIEYLIAQGIVKDQMKVAALYCTPGGRKKFPDIFVVQETSEEVLEELPWVAGPYRRI